LHGERTRGAMKTRGVPPTLVAAPGRRMSINLGGFPAGQAQPAVNRPDVELPAIPLRSYRR